MIDKVMMNTALEFSKMSYCKRSQVGAVLAIDKRIVATGYNGTIAGVDNQCETVCEACDGVGLDCKVCEGRGSVTNDFVLHAEQNLLTFCNREGLKTKGGTLYVTMAPCKTCSKLIASAGIKRVVYKEAYRNMEGVEFLKRLKIEVNRSK